MEDEGPFGEDCFWIVTWRAGTDGHTNATDQLVAEICEIVAIELEQKSGKTTSLAEVIKTVVRHLVIDNCPK